MSTFRYSIFTYGECQSRATINNLRQVKSFRTPLFSFMWQKKKEIVLKKIKNKLEMFEFSAGTSVHYVGVASWILMYFLAYGPFWHQERLLKLPRSRVWFH